MKKVMMMAAITAALVSCQSKGNQNQEALWDDGVLEIAGNDSSAVAVYEGILPAADGSGIEYVLSVDSIGPDGESGFTLVTTYLDADGQGKNKSFTTKGKKQVIKKTVKNKPKTAYKLKPNDGSSPIYFVVVNDTTLRLVNDSLQESVSNLNYDIIQVK
ncbi:MAG: copper resistance protein NlpE N-terminal domain-containing protein [Bacteroides sp.]|nr:copper resistance protein NlpE N-terminal domain-containing protein [Bacteroides sp.]